MVATVVRDCPGARVVILAMEGGMAGPAAAGDRDGPAAVIELADFRPGTARRRTSSGLR
ncbi:hypothetical protein ABZS66_59345 [Dactylosporangium sp. NPDC005572]|uniref:hypothetical protein n=1 Tax=Dactylosporangium sp. NPDC005572 TaxID=3156889 RepID=UPI0033A84092